MNQWTMLQDKDGYLVSVYRVPFWTICADRFWDFFFGCLTLHLFCCRAPEFLWRIPLGRPRYDYSDFMKDEKGRPWIDNSLGSWLYHTMSRLTNIEFRHEVRFGEFRITKEEARKINPEWVQESEDAAQDEAS